MTINEIQDEVVEEFADLDDDTRFQILIDLGSEQQPLEACYKTDENLIDGCQSRVWLVSEMTAEGRLIFRAESDALIVRGIVMLLIRVLSDHTPREIVDADLYFIRETGLAEHLSPTRSNGLMAMLRRMKVIAAQHL